MSIFFSFGSLFAALFSYLFMAYEETCDAYPCHTSGWRYVIATCACVSALMLLGRRLLITLQESPRWLLEHNRELEAINTLEAIKRFNDCQYMDSITHVYNESNLSPVKSDGTSTIARPRTIVSSPIRSSPSSSILKRLYVKISLQLFSNISGIFSSHLRMTSILLFLIWPTINLGYTMFNVFLSSFLEVSGKDTHNNVYVECLIYAAFSVPGSIVGAWLVDHQTLGRKWTMALSTALCGAGLWIWAVWGLGAGTSGIFWGGISNLFGTVMYAGKFYLSLSFL